MVTTLLFRDEIILAKCDIKMMLSIHTTRRRAVSTEGLIALAVLPGFMFLAKI